MDHLSGPHFTASGSSWRGYSTGPSLVHSFWPSFTAPAGQYSTHRPQATHWSVSTRATVRLMPSMAMEPFSTT